jgi:hypothetical protein
LSSKKLSQSLRFSAIRGVGGQFLRRASTPAFDGGTLASAGQPPGPPPGRRRSPPGRRRSPPAPSLPSSSCSSSSLSSLFSLLSPPPPKRVEESSLFRVSSPAQEDRDLSFEARFPAQPLPFPLSSSSSVSSVFSSSVFSSSSSSCSRISPPTPAADERRIPPPVVSLQSTSHEVERPREAWSLPFSFPVRFHLAGLSILGEDEVGTVGKVGKVG